MTALLLAAASKVPYGVDEYGLAGALNGAPVPVVQAKTFDALVPANAELVIEGVIRTDEGALSLEAYRAQKCAQ